MLGDLQMLSILISLKLWNQSKEVVIFAQSLCGSEQVTKPLSFVYKYKDNNTRELLQKVR